MVAVIKCVLTLWAVLAALVTLALCWTVIDSLAMVSIPKAVFKGLK